MRIDAHLNLQRPIGPVWRVPNLSLVISLIVLLCLPQFIFVQFGTSSLAAGMVLTALAVVAINFPFLRFLRIKKYEAKIVCLVFALIIASALASYFIDDQIKPLLTVGALFPLILAIFVLCTRFERTGYAELDRVFAAVLFVLLVLGWLKISGATAILNYARLSKPVFPFSEESNYALALSPLLFAHGYGKKSAYKIFIILNVFAQAVLFPSVTLIVVALLATFIYWGVSNKIIFIVFVSSVLLLGSAFYTFGSDSAAFDYVMSRVVISKDSDNLTALVYLQGWDEAIRAFLSSKGVGLGFQMLGTNEAGDIAEIIAEKAGIYKNREDGSFFASKIIAEFGVLGIVVVVAFLAFCVKYARYVSLSKPEATQPRSDIPTADTAKMLALMGVIFSYLIELLFRGYGYFSPSLVLVLTAFFVYRRLKIKFT